MIDLKKFNRKKLFKSKAVLFVGAAVITAILAITAYAVIKAQNAAKLATGSSKEIKIKPTKEVVSTETLWRDAISTQIKDLAKTQNEILNKEIIQLKLEIEQAKKEQQEQLEKRSDTALAGKVSNLEKELTNIKSRNNIIINETPTSKNNDIFQYNLHLENAQNSDNYK